MQLFRNAIDECGFLDMGGTREILLHGKNSIKVGKPFGRGWIGVSQTMSGLYSLEVPWCIT